MEFELKLQQRYVVRLVVGIPDGGEGVRARLESDAGDVVTLEEGTLAALVRAYMAVSTHPQTRAVELRASTVPASKSGFGGNQLMEVAADEARLRRDLAGLGPAAAAIPRRPAPAATTPPPARDPSLSLNPSLVLDADPAGEPDLGDMLEMESGQMPVAESDELELDEPDTSEAAFGTVPARPGKRR